MAQITGDIQYIRGTDTPYQITYTYDDGTVVDITGATVYFTVKENEEDSDTDAIFQKTITSHSDPANGVTDVTVLKTDTNSASLGYYYYDTRIVFSDGSVRSIRGGRFQMLANITQAIT